jgi:uncharacterized membrane protein
MTFFDNLIFPIHLCATVSCGLIAGIFFAFSNFVMSALDKIAPNQGIAAMQSINLTVLNPLFLGVFIGAALLSMVLVCFSVLHWHHPSSPWLLAGGILYLAGSVLVTTAFNVPLNEALARLDPSSLESVTFWRTYVSKWNMWNHVRATASLLASFALVVGLSRHT